KRSRWTRPGGGMLEVTRCRRGISNDDAKLVYFAGDQNPSRSRKRNERPSFSVLVICPKFAAVRLRPGSANWGVFERLMASAGRVMLQSPGRAEVRPKGAFKFAIFPFRKVLRPRFPAISMGVQMKRNAERCSNRTEVSGFPMVRPSTEGSTTIGRSPPL